MAARRINLSLQSGPVGPLRDQRTVDISSNDFVDEFGFICQVVTAGNLTFRTLGGSSDQTVNSLAAGGSINVAGVPVLLQAVRSSSTVTSIVVGIP